MKRVYLDNAATTPMAKEVLDAMMPFMTDEFGNPSSMHSYGRTTKNAIERSRKQIANFLNVHPHEIYFTSGGTEADNIALNCAVNDLGVTRIITSPIEHHAVLHTAECIRDNKGVELDIVKLTDKGHIDLNHLEELLSQNKPTLVSLMHGNNEIGNLLPLKKVSEMCAKYDAFFHSDTVQTMGHYSFDLQDLNIHFITCAAHKFHGPKGVGFLYVNNNIKFNPIQHGGAQERGGRGGTENLYGVIGLAKAMELAYDDVEEHIKYVQGLKSYMRQKILEIFPDIIINGETEPEKSLYTVLSIGFPNIENKQTFLFGLDLRGVAASGGSACSSGSNKGSHVLTAIKSPLDYTSIRFSFSRYTTDEEIDFAIEALKQLIPVTV